MLVKELAEKYDVKGSKKMHTPEALEDYIKSNGSDIWVDDIPEDYYNALQQVLPDRFLLYRAFESDHVDAGDSPWEHKDKDQLVSFTESRRIAEDIAQDRSEHYGTVGVVVEIRPSKKDIYFHWKYDELGTYYKEKEVLVKAVGYDYKVLKQYVV